MTLTYDLLTIKWYSILHFERTTCALNLNFLHHVIPKLYRSWDNKNYNLFIFTITLAFDLVIKERYSELHLLWTMCVLNLSNRGLVLCGAQFELLTVKPPIRKVESSNKFLAFWMLFVASWGDRKQKSENSSRKSKPQTRAPLRHGTQVREISQNGVVPILSDILIYNGLDFWLELTWYILT